MTPEGARGAARGPGRPPRSPVRWAAAALLASSAAASGAPQEVDAETSLRPGLRAEVFANATLDGPAAAVRADPDLQFEWGDAPPDLRVPPGPFSIRWTGRLFAADDGEHEILLFLQGAARVAIGGKTILEGEKSEPGWVEGTKVLLEYGHHALDVEFRKTSPESRMGLYWVPPSLELEPVGADHLFEPPSGVPAGGFERGLRLVRTLRCAACHEIPGAPRPPLAPSLASVESLPRPEHILRRISSPRVAVPGSRMPEMGLTSVEAEAASAWLLAAGSSPRKDGTRPAAEDPAPGRRLVLSRGCLACHTLEGAGVEAHGPGGSLEGAGSRRTREALVRFLSRGQSPGGTSVHRPEIAWREGDLRHAAAFLASLVAPAEAADGAGPSRVPAPESPQSNPRRDAQQAAKGRDVVLSHGCAACHELPGGEGTAAQRTPLPRRRTAGTSCLEPAAPGSIRPYFPLAGAERQAIEELLDRAAPDASLSPFEEGRLLVEEKRCTRCHPRDGGTGLVEASSAAATLDPALRGMEPALRPPSLSSAGDKFLPDVLLEAISGRLPRRRPWLEVRMPLFTHTPEEEQALLRYLEAHDAIPPRPGAPIPDAANPDEKTVESTDEIAAGRHLVGPRGFGCSSCHAVGPQVPAGIALATRGPDLLDTTARLRRPWFMRWLSDPSRIAPGIEMPAIRSAYPGVLGGDRERQLAALWGALGSKGFSLPARAGVVRELGFRPGEPVLIRDVFRAPGPPGGWIPRGLAIGLPSGHGLLYDLDRFALAGTWTGGFARQLTEGKTWYWEAAGDLLNPGLPPVPILGARIEGRLLFPAMESPGSGRLESWRRASARGIELTYRIDFGGRRIDVSEGFEALEGGYRRRVAASGFPREARPVIVIGVEANGARLESGGSVIVSRTARGPLQVSSGKPREWRRLEALPWTARAALFEQDLEEIDGTSLAVIDWTVAADAPRAGAPAAPPPRAPLETGGGERLGADAFPGFRAVRLDLDEAFMPTAFAFGPEGTVYVSSLKGDVLRLRDADGDGLPEETASFSDPLSAPMGLLADEKGLVVSHKPELLRLTDTDGDGRADFARVIATGWGFTNDYHDWTVGLVRQRGRHVVVTGSDYGQKGRGPATTRMRGKLLSILDDGKVEVEGRGIRFAMGLAQNRDGEVFFTDNQGEGNTFNELNHSRRGRYFGVPSLEDPPGEAPGKGDARPEPPALVFPHPWTRSVNGITFLDGGGRFAPYEGHGIGCEYDNRMLVRFTLEKAGETYQGACYPFSRAPSLLGPYACAASPGGRLYVGDLRDSGWGGGSNVGAIVLLEREGAPPPGILEARAWQRGFDIQLTTALEARAAADPRSYVLTAYRRIWKGGYATADQDLRTLEVKGVEVKDGGKTIRLEVEPFTAGFVHEIHVRARPPTGEPLWPAVAHYTLNSVPGG